VPPPRPWPPLPEPVPPFDLDALDDLDPDRPPSAPVRRRHWWQRAPHTPTAPSTAPRPHGALLALVPEPEQSRRIKIALRAAGAHYTVPVRITLLTGLDERDVHVWGKVVHGIVGRFQPFTVRLVGPEVVRDRTVYLRATGAATQRLQHQLQAALGPEGYAVDDPRNVSGPVLPLAGTWTELNRAELHDLATGMRDELRTPVEFRASSVYAFDAAADDDLPFLDFPLTG
jgi:2'-5' RNA ligase superfamily